MIQKELNRSIYSQEQLSRLSHRTRDLSTRKSNSHIIKHHKLRGILSNFHLLLTGEN